MKEKTCCFTGHRFIPANQYQSIVKETEKAVEELIAQGYLFFCAGGALGFDTIAEKIILNLKSKYHNIHLTLVLPCLTQTEKWLDKDKEIYDNIKSRADKVTYISQNYTNDCMFQRNRQLVDISSVCICYLTKKRGGTLYTVNYAQKSDLKIINIANQIGDNACRNDTVRG